MTTGLPGNWGARRQNGGVQPAPTPDPPRVSSAVSRLRAAGERVTPARYAVLRVVDAADRTDEHLTAEEIGARVAQVEPSVHRATVYRNLTALAGTGVLSHVHLGGSDPGYHLAEPAPEHSRAHAHVQCHSCGRVLDVPSDTLEEVAEKLSRDLGFVVDTGHAALLGTCRDCRTR